MQFDDLIEAQLAGAVIRCSTLACFNFKSGPMRVWPGFGKLAAGGCEWDGTRGLGSISSVTAGTGGAVDEVTCALFGDASLVKNLDADADESDGQVLDLKIQFFDVRKFDADDKWVDWQPLGDMIAFFRGRMGPLSISMSAPDQNSRRLRSIKVSALSALTNRGRPPFSYYSDRDQKARDPTGTDNLFLNISKYTSYTVKWPKFS